MIAPEWSIVHYGRTQIPYRIRRSARRATVSVAVDAADGVLLTAPVGVGIGRLDRVVRRKAAWIVERLRLFDRLHARQPPREFVSGESVVYLGRHYRLSVLKTGQDGAARLEHGWLVVPAARPPARAQARDVREALIAWFVTRASARLPERVSMWSGKVGVKTPAVIVKGQRKRWGSCDQRGVVRFNWRIIQAPMRLVDYVVVHELCHLLHRDHDRRFWTLLGRVMPDYDARRDELAAFGPRVEW